MSQAKIVGAIIVGTYFTYDKKKFHTKNFQQITLSINSRRMTTQLENRPSFD